MNLVKIEGYDLYKDTRTGVIHNTNKKEILLARKRKEKRIEKDKELHDLKNEVSEIKDMLNQILGKL